MVDEGWAAGGWLHGWMDGTEDSVYGVNGAEEEDFRPGGKHHPGRNFLSL